MMMVTGFVLVLASPAQAVLSIMAEPRTELLYSTESPDCTELHKKQSAELPFNVVRLHVLNDGQPIDPSTVRLQWELRDNAAGRLAADLDLGPKSNTPIVTAMCANFGNGCELTGDALNIYHEETIFYVAPDCSTLKRDPTKPFNGGSDRIRVKGFVGKRKLGKADVTIGYGNNGSATVGVLNNVGNVDDGIGKTAVLTGLRTLYAGRVQQPTGQPKPPTSFVITGQLGGGALTDQCPTSVPYDRCGVIEHGGERGVQLLTATFDDASAVCDNVRVVIGNCSPDISGQLTVTPDPRRTTYDPANPSQSTVHLTVRFKNTSKPQGDLRACNFDLLGSNILTCSSTLKAKGFTDTKMTSFSLPHCSTANATCQTSADCPMGERCLVNPYCSSTTSRDCSTDADCAAPACPECQPNEICVHMLKFPSGEIFLEPGESVTLLDDTAILRNRFPATAAVSDTWTVNVHIPSISVSKSLKYKIRSRP
jgi:hypothetical protein